MAGNALADSAKLLSLYLSWPGRGDGKDLGEESTRFYCWLLDERASVPLVRRLQGPRAVQTFFAANARIIEKYRLKERREEHRSEPRLVQQLNVLVSQYNKEKGLLENSVKCKTVNLGVHGIRVTSSVAVPGRQILYLSLTPVGFPIRIFNLLGEPRWQETTESGCQVGIRLQEAEDFASWRQEFPVRFAE